MVNQRTYKFMDPAHNCETTNVQTLQPPTFGLTKRRQKFLLFCTCRFKIYITGYGMVFYIYLKSYIKVIKWSVTMLRMPMTHKDLMKNKTYWVNDVTHYGLTRLDWTWRVSVKANITFHLKSYAFSICWITRRQAWLDWIDSVWNRPNRIQRSQIESRLTLYDAAEPFVLQRIPDCLYYISVTLYESI
jgi:hypothetical protein